MMDFVCPLCGKKIERDVLSIKNHTDEHVIEAIKKKYPKWAKKDGTCNKCYDFYRKQLGLKNRA
ncbi:MAG: hypothetical protein JW867_06425 [Candidatus Omnitrophica bacterium]|nr:hypothetical protein [Candidatus Omnitrophota bacterium]